MDNPNLLIAAMFVLLLALSLLGLFVFLVRAMKEDNREAITRLQKVVTKIQGLDNASDRLFKECGMLLNRKLQGIFSDRMVQRWEYGTQTDSGTEELGTSDVALQTDMGRVNSLPTLLVRPVI